MLILPNLICRFNVIKIPASYFVDIDKTIPKFIWKDKRLRIDNAVLQKNKVGGLTLPDFKICYKVIVINIAWY